MKKLKDTNLGKRLARLEKREVEFTEYIILIDKCIQAISDSLDCQEKYVEVTLARRELQTRLLFRFVLCMLVRALVPDVSPRGAHDWAEALLKLHFGTGPRRQKK